MGIEQRKGDQALIDAIRTEEGALPRTAPPAGLEGKAPKHALKTVLTSLDDAKAEDIVTIDIAGKSALGDHMVVTSGRSHRHVGAIADRLLRDLKDGGFGRARVEGLPHCDWVLIDAGDLIVHIFRPEVREFYNIEKMWLADPELRAQA
jgi:ribosome-associated protein